MLRIGEITGLAGRVRGNKGPLYNTNVRILRLDNWYWKLAAAPLSAGEKISILLQALCGKELPER